MTILCNVYRYTYVVSCILLYLYTYFISNSSGSHYLYYEVHRDTKVRRCSLLLVIRSLRKKRKEGGAEKMPQIRPSCVICTCRLKKKTPNFVAPTNRIFLASFLHVVYTDVLRIPYCIPALRINSTIIPRLAPRLTIEQIVLFNLPPLVKTWFCLSVAKHAETKRESCTSRINSWKDCGH